jgi:hypothetical protein
VTSARHRTRAGVRAPGPGGATTRVLTPAAGLPSGRAPQLWATTQARKPDTDARWWFTGPGHPARWSRQPDTSPGHHRGEPIVAAGGGAVLDEALQVEHYPGR